MDSPARQGTLAVAETPSAGTRPQGLPGQTVREVPRADRGTALMPEPPSAAIVC